MKYLAESVKGNIIQKNLEYFDEFLPGYAYVFTNNICTTKSYNYYNPGWIIQNNDIGDKGDKGSSIVIMKK